MTKSLGKKLADTLEQEKYAKAEDLQKESRKKQKKYQAVFQFFESVKRDFTEAIEAGQATPELFVQVGGRHYAHSGLAQYFDVFDTIDGFEHTGEMPKSMAENGIYHVLWQSFQDWAASNDLSVSWHYAWDGGGMSSWWIIRVSPADTSSAPTEPNTVSRIEMVTLSHAEALKTLRELAEACIGLQSTLACLSGHDMAMDALRQYVTTCDMAKQLKDNLT